MLVAQSLSANLVFATFIAIGIGSRCAAVVPERIAALIEELRSDEFDRREAAAQELEKVGESVLPQLRTAALESKDFEVRFHAEQLIFEVLRAAGVSTSTDMTFAVIERGEFSMGTPEDQYPRQNNQTPHPVRITRSFLLGTHEVTQKQYEHVMKVNPSGFAEARSGNKQSPDPVADKVEGMDTTAFPVEQISWYDAIAFCNQLSNDEGLVPSYTMESITREGHSITNAAVTSLETNGYRLPTEAEWEFACRAGTVTPFNYGEPTNGSMANLKGDNSYASTQEGFYVGHTVKVGSYKPNARGLWNMHGNVSEWCWDWYGPYDDGPLDDPQGPAEGRQRVQRGGAWLVTEQNCCSSSRLGVAPGERKNHAGFRVARSP